ncbi:MAG: glycosyl transferase family 1, partial [Anaerolineae bacterium]|nr:glycosyl transferase family 1 [Anaerolineae bacterium]
KREIYEEVIAENAVRTWLPHDIVVVHDPQPLPFINHFKKGGPWIWRCHIDLTSPNQEAWGYLRQYIEKYDAAILTLEEYRQPLAIPQVF